MAFIVDINGNKQSLNLRKTQTKDEEIEHYNNHANSVVEHFTMPGMDKHPEWASWLLLSAIILLVLAALWKLDVHRKLMNLVRCGNALAMARFGMGGANAQNHFGFRFY